MIFEALTEESLWKTIKALDLGKNEITTVDSFVEFLTTTQITNETRAEIDKAIKEREEIIKKSKGKASEIPAVVEN